MGNAGQDRFFSVTMPHRLACAGLAFPLLPYDKALDRISALPFVRDDIGLTEAESSSCIARVLWCGALRGVLPAVMAAAATRRPWARELRPRGSVQRAVRSGQECRIQFNQVFPGGKRT